MLPGKRDGVIGSVWVTPHAAQRYAERVEPCDHDEAVRRIVADVQACTSVRQGPGDLVTVTGARPRRIRYRIAAPLPGRELPAVVTVVTRCR